MDPGRELTAVSRDLYTRVVERTVFPMLDRVNRTSIARKLEQLLSWEHLHRDEIRRRQAEKLERAVERARRDSQFYRRFWVEREKPQNRRWRDREGGTNEEFGFRR